VFWRIMSGKSFLDLHVSGGMRCRREETALRAMNAIGKAPVRPAGT